MSVKNMQDGAAAERITWKNPRLAGVALLVTVVLMTCIFATLDNAVTLAHAAGTMDVGRILRTFKIKKNVEVTDNGKIII